MYITCVRTKYILCITKVPNFIGVSTVVYYSIYARLKIFEICAVYCLEATATRICKKVEQWKTRVEFSLMVLSLIILYTTSLHLSISNIFLSVHPLLVFTDMESAFYWPSGSVCCLIQYRTRWLTVFFADSHTHSSFCCVYSSAFF